MIGTRALLLRTLPALNFRLSGLNEPKNFWNILPSQAHNKICKHYNIQNDSTLGKVIDQVIKISPIAANIYSEEFNAEYLLEFQNKLPSEAFKNNFCFSTKEQYIELQPFSVQEKSRINMFNRDYFSLQSEFLHTTRFSQLFGIYQAEPQFYANIDNMSKIFKVTFNDSDATQNFSEEMLPHTSKLYNHALHFMEKEGDYVQIKQLPYPSEAYEKIVLMIVDNSTKIPSKLEGIRQVTYKSKESKVTTISQVAQKEISCLFF